MQVGDEIQGLAFSLQVQKLAQRPIVIAEMEAAGGLDTGENAHVQVPNAMRRVARMPATHSARQAKRAATIAGIFAQECT